MDPVSIMTIKNLEWDSLIENSVDPDDAKRAKWEKQWYNQMYSYYLTLLPRLKEWSAEIEAEKQKSKQSLSNYETPDPQPLSAPSL
jgi:hypothetical protein